MAPSQFTRIWTFRNAHVLVALYPVLVIYASAFARHLDMTPPLRIFITIYATITVAVNFHIYLTFFVKRLALKLIVLRHGVGIAASSETPKEDHAQRNRSALYFHQGLAAVTLVNLAVYFCDDTATLIKGSMESLQRIVLDAFFTGIYWRIALSVAHGIGLVYGLLPEWDALLDVYVSFMIQIIQIYHEYSSNSHEHNPLWILVHISDVFTGLYTYYFLWIIPVAKIISGLTLFTSRQANGEAGTTDTRWLVAGIAVIIGMAFYTRKDGDLFWGTATKLWEMYRYGAIVCTALCLPLLFAISHGEQLAKLEAQGDAQEDGSTPEESNRTKDVARPVQEV
ncbi:hypothetical protein MPER_04240 [Moniliophthora perniciosa FA553]|nr:hypothetical protein MPER_04240 [Moniliophthora perniciosa FA553]